MIGSITSVQHDGGSIFATVEGEGERRVVAVDHHLYMQIVQARGGAEHVAGQFVEVVEQGTASSIRLLSDIEWLHAKDDQARKRRAEALAAAKTAAARKGKAPFDYVALCRLYDPSSDLGDVVHDPAARARELEARYYLDYPDVMDLRTFAERLAEADTYR